MSGPSKERHQLGDEVQQDLKKSVTIKTWYQQSSDIRNSLTTLTLIVTQMPPPDHSFAYVLLRFVSWGNQVRIRSKNSGTKQFEGSLETWSAYLRKQAICRE